MRFVESSVVIAKSPELVLSAFTQVDHLQKWWGVERSLIELRPGGLYSLVWKITDDAMGFVTTGYGRSIYSRLSIEDREHGVLQSPTTCFGADGAYGSCHT